MRIKKILLRCVHPFSNNERRFVVTSKNPRFDWYKGSSSYQVLKEWEVEVKER